MVIIKSYKQPNSELRGNLLQFCLFCLFTLHLFSFLYAALQVLNPFVYLSFVLTFLMGYFIAYVSRIYARLFKIVSDKALKLITIIGSIYVFIDSNIATILLGDSGIENIDVFFNPILYFKIDASQFLHNAYLMEWSSYISYGDSGGKLTVAVIFSKIVELSILMILSLRILRFRPIIPFSISQNKWYKRLVIDINTDHVIDQPEFIKLFLNDPKTALLSNSKGNANSNARYTLYYLDGEETQYFTVENIRISRDGKRSYKKPIIQLMSIGTTVAEKLLNSGFRIKKRDFTEEF